MRNMVGLFGWLMASFITAAIGAVASVSAPEFYNQLQQPQWAPPDWLFGPVWSILYLLMAVSAWLVWRRLSAPGARPALILFAVHLPINAVWSWVFFAWHLGLLATLNIGVLILLVGVIIFRFARIDALAGALLVPYLVWISFAGALCFAMWQANPAVL